MKGIFVICEGHTERDVIVECFKPYFYDNWQITIHPKLILTSKNHFGGLLNWKHLKRTIETLSKTEKNGVFTTFCDYYKFPRNDHIFNSSNLIMNIDQRIESLEFAIKNNIIMENNNIFLPYIQKHEFEGLLFSSQEWSKTFLNEIGQNLINQIIGNYPPEDINDGENTAPSKRLLKIFKEHSNDNGPYNKRINGSLIFEDIGIETILKFCPRFNNWVDTLVKLSGSE